MAGHPSQIRLLLVEDVAQVAQYVRNLLNAQDQVKLLDVLADATRILDQIRELRPDVVVIDALLQGKVGGLAAAEAIRQAGVDLPLIILTVPQKPVKVGTGMGVVKVLGMPFSGFDFMNAIQAANREHAALAPESISRTYVVYAPKGGIGRTTLTFNIGVAAAQSGLKVVVVDGSLQFADMRALLRVPDTSPSILGLPTDRIAESDLTDVLWRDPSGVDILLAPPRPEMAEMVTVRDIEKALSLLKRVYNLVLIDTPTSITDTVLAYIDASDGIVELVTADWTTVRNTRAVAQTLHAIGYPADQVHYVLNRADAPAGMPRETLLEQLGRTPEFEVASDGRVVLEANNQGVPFVLAEPSARVSQDVGRIAAALTTRPSSGAGIVAGRRA